MSGTNFIHLIAAARCLSVEDFGLFSLAWAVLIFIGNCHQSLVQLPLAVLYAEYAPSAARAYLAKLERFHLYLPLLLVPAGVVAWFLPDWQALILATALTALLRLTAEHQRRVAYVLADSPRALLIDAVTYGPLALCACWWWSHPQPLTIPILMLATAAPALLGWLLGHQMLKHARIGGASDLPSRSALHQHWSFGRWVLLNSLSSYVGNQAYPFIIAGYLGLRDVAVLAAARSTIGVSHVVLMGLSAYGTPRVRQAFVEQGWAGLQQSLGNNARMTALLLVPLLGVCALWPQPIISALIGASYAEQAWIFRWYAGLYVLIGINSVLTIALQALKEPRAGTLGSGLAAILTLAAGPWIVQTWGVPGVILAMVFNACIFLAVGLFWIQRLRPRLHA